MILAALYNETHHAKTDSADTARVDYGNGSYILHDRTSGVMTLHATGHGAFPPRAATGGSADVFVRGLGVQGQGDPWAIHCNPTPVCHGSALAAGSSSVFANSLALGRVGDPIDCGSFVATGAATVFVGG
ncbi:MAG: PAAR domain-containing protein [Hyphomicrobiales bacterium]